MASRPIVPSQQAPIKEFALQRVKYLVASTLSHEQRHDVLKFIETIGKRDIIGLAPLFISTHILEYFTPKELVAFRLGKERKEKKKDTCFITL